MFESENKTLTKEGLIHFLELYAVRSPPYSPELSEVLTSQFLPPSSFAIFRTEKVKVVSVT